MLRRLCVGFVLMIGWGAVARAQSAAVEPGVQSVLQSLGARADVVLEAEVTGIRRGTDAVTVVLRVISVVQGTAGAEYVLREWPGLWGAGQRRYWLGEHALFFLHAPSETAHFASPVDGLDGVVPVSNTAAGAVVDAGRIATRTLRPQGAAMVQAGGPQPLSAIAALLRPGLTASPGRTTVPVRGLPLHGVPVAAPNLMQRTEAVADALR